MREKPANCMDRVKETLNQYRINGVLQHPARSLGEGTKLMRMKNFYVLYITETCKIWALVAATD